ncbi:hypothetical protein [Nitrosomonas aestuarii]|uniref:hypothetical protein n=1 Tax=Nitrosomonas aestuarii TaxID=52441 RepID=UPI00147ED231|nr:hypothetical protein [Nitrosomonas aestuarii]
MPHNETQSSKQIFISYSRTDHEARNAPRSALEQAGCSVSQDDKAIRAGDR